MHASLLAFVSSQMHMSPEIVATTSLAYIFQRNDSARNALRQIQELHGLVAQDIDVVETEEQLGEVSRSDINCYDEEGRLRIIIEAKFWSGLTDAQPVEYLKALRNSEKGLLLFLVPKRRMESVWGNVIQRLDAAGIDYKLVPGTVRRTIAVNGNARVGIVSWNELLRDIDKNEADSSESNQSDDIKQLKGLCTEVEEEVFVPLQGSEITSQEIPRLVRSLGVLVNDLTNKLQRERLISDAISSNSPNGIGFRMKIGRHAGWVGVDFEQWAKLGASPVWLHIYFDRGGLTFLESRLRSYRVSEPPGAYRLSQSMGLPVRLPTGADEEETASECVRQVRNVYRALVR